MEVSARLKGAPISAQKCRLIADQVRGMAVGQAEQMLSFSPKKAAGIVRKVLMSAIANAENNEGADIDDLRIKAIFIDEGTTQRRFRARAKGRGSRILKRTSHVTVTVSDNQAAS